MGPSGSSKTTLLGMTCSLKYTLLAQGLWLLLACRKDSVSIVRLLWLACTDVLAGRKTVGTISGKILFAGQHATKTFLRRYTGYVEQFGECYILPVRHQLCMRWIPVQTCHA